MNPVKLIDNWLNRITMYKLLVYGFSLTLAISVILSLTGVLSYSGLSIFATSAVVLVSCFVSNKLLSLIFRTTTNNESYLITALILALILPPSTKLVSLLYVGLTGLIAMASKFIISYKHSHIFNPAAFGAATVSVSGLLSVTWWVGSPTMLPFVVILGLLVLRKIHKFKLVLVFLIAASLMMLLVAQVSGNDAYILIKNAFLSGPLVFFATIMLTEPATMPSRKYYQLLYGLLIGTLYSSQLRYGVLSASPHVVLLAGNIFAYSLNPKVRLKLSFVERYQVSEQVYDFVFKPDRLFTFIPGQYMEWTLGHKKIDSRGNRRSFTLASSPTEKEVHLGVKIYDLPSSFKAALMSMETGSTIVVGHISGNFILPKDLSKKLVFMAGGIGITPFRSMVQYLTDTKQKRDIILFYFVGTADELAYKDLFESANRVGLRFVPVVGKRLSIALLKDKLPGYKERYYYISGPNSFVEAYRDLLRKNDVPRHNIITDYFSGY